MERLVLLTAIAPVVMLTGFLNFLFARLSGRSFLDLSSLAGAGRLVLATASRLIETL
jgi:hypothetical protein